jgi:hypothetical protein
VTSQEESERRFAQKGAKIAWRDVIFIASIGAGIFYVGMVSKQIEVNTGRIESLEREGPPKMMVLQEQLSQEIHRSIEADLDQRKMIEELKLITTANREDMISIRNSNGAILDLLRQHMRRKDSPTAGR